MNTKYNDYNDYLNKHNVKNIYLIIVGICFFIYSLMNYTMSQNTDYVVFFINHNNQELDFNLIGLFLSNYSHLNFLHLSINLFLGYMLTKRISLFLVLTKKDFLLFHTLGAFVMSITLFTIINYMPHFKEITQAHLGYSSILFGLFAILMYTCLSIKEKVINILFIFLIYIFIEFAFISSETTQISHLGHFIGFLTGIVYCVITKKEFKK